LNEIIFARQSFQNDIQFMNDKISFYNQAVKCLSSIENKINDKINKKKKDEEDEINSSWSKYI